MRSIRYSTCLIFVVALAMVPGTTSAQDFVPDYFVPSASHASGAEGSFWVTDLEVNNGGTTTATYQLAWLPRKADNSLPIMSEVFTLDPGKAERIEDVVLSIFNVTGNGALAVVSDSADLFLFSRTYNDTDLGTFGTAIPGIAEVDLMRGPTKKRVLFFTENADYRSNIAFQNGTPTNLRVNWERFLADGSLVESGTTDLAPYSNKQLNAIYENEAPAEAAYMDVWTETAEGKFMVFASVVDNATSDGTVVQPQLYTQGSEPPPPDANNVCDLGRCADDSTYAEECDTFMDECLPDSTTLISAQDFIPDYFVPSASHASGAEGSFWVTDLEVNNGGTTTATYQLAWLPRKADNSLPIMSEVFTLDPGKAERIEDVVLSIFNVTGNGALAVVSDSADLFLFSRTYNDTDLGTFGTAIPGIAEVDLMRGPTKKRVLFFTENADYRSNIAFQNGTPTNLRVNWERFLADGSLVESGTTDLAPYSNKQLNAIYENEAPAEAAYMDVWTETAEGKFMVFASVVDNATSDGTVVQPQLYTQGSEPPPPDANNVCDLGRCADDSTYAEECDTFMDECLPDSATRRDHCILAGYYLCHRDDVPGDDLDIGVCSEHECAANPNKQEECLLFLSECPFALDRRCFSAAFLFCRDLGDPGGV